MWKKKIKNDLKKPKIKKKKKTAASP